MRLCTALKPSQHIIYRTSFNRAFALSAPQRASFATTSAKDQTPKEKKPRKKKTAEERFNELEFADRFRKLGLEPAQETPPEAIELVKRPPLRRRPPYGGQAKPREREKVYFPSWNMEIYTTGKRLAKNKIAFKVPIKFNKVQIRQYLETIYNCKIKKVNTMNYEGKKHRIRARSNLWFKEPDYKKAIVTLASASSMPPPPPPPPTATSAQTQDTK